jgi:selenoprotein W-related protein
MPVSPMIKITYCRLCGWGLRAGWMAQELLSTFSEETRLRDAHPG